MSEDDFKKWVAEMRKEVVYLWDECGEPPRVGFSEEDIIDQFRKFSNFNVDNFLVTDELDKTKSVIRNTSIIGNAANQWFPTMMKTKINYTSDTKGGLSIYDHFKNHDLLDKMITYGHRHFKRDSFYHYSRPVKHMCKEDIYAVKTATEWIQRFEEYRNSDTKLEYDYFLEPKEKESEYTGYDENLRNVSYLRLSKDQIKELNIPERCQTISKLEKFKDVNEYQIRLFELNKHKIFPAGLKAFRISVCQYAVNFPPLTARYLYERYTKEVPGKAIIWDPSSGWGGRILGAMGTNRELHYIGTDPNTDHNTDNGRTKYHELADFFNSVKRGDTGSAILPFLAPTVNTYEIYQCGSEEMAKQEGFQKYKGKVDVVFTSPPYFAKEIYSDDPEQSANKFSTFDTWVTGFLHPTLETAAKWLKPGGYLLWNIADAQFGGEMLPLESKSTDYIKDVLGLEYIETLKMALAQMPGGNRVDEEGKPRAKNFCKVLEAKKKDVTKQAATKEIWFKYEPIFVFRKK